MIDLAAERPTNPDLLFVGGTGRSGTHVVSQLLANHSHYARVPIEARFHVNPQGFPDLLSGQVSPDQFLRKMKRFWWRRIRAGEVAPVRRPPDRLRPQGPRAAQGRRQGPLRRRRSTSSSAPRATTSSSPAATSSSTCSGRSPSRRASPALIEMSCFTIAESPTLIRLFPDAKLIHTVRDGRDAGSSKVSKRQKRSHPRDGSEGLRWWEGRLRKIEAGVRELPDGRLLTISLDELVDGDREGVYGEILAYLGLEDEPGMRAFFEDEMSADGRTQGAVARGAEPEQQDGLVLEYEKTLDRLEREGFHCAPELRRAYEHQPV